MEPRSLLRGQNGWCSGPILRPKSFKVFPFRLAGARENAAVPRCACQRQGGGRGPRGWGVPPLRIRCRANIAHMKHSRPDSGRDCLLCSIFAELFRKRVLTPIQLFPPLRSELVLRNDRDTSGKLISHEVFMLQKSIPTQIRQLVL